MKVCSDKLLKFVILLSVGLLTTSCGLFKNTSREKERVRQETNVSMESTGVSKESGSVTTKDIEKDVRTVERITETTETTKTVTPSAKVTTSIKDLESEKPVTLIDSNGRTIALLLNTVSGILEVAISGDTAVRTTTRTETDRMIVDSSKVFLRDSIYFHLDSFKVNHDSVVNIDRKTSSKESRVSTKGIVTGIGLIFLLVFAIWFIFFRVRV